MVSYNTWRLIKIAKMAMKYGADFAEFCEDVARRAGEEGNDAPSDEAIEIAKRKLAALKAARTRERRRQERG